MISIEEARALVARVPGWKRADATEFRPLAGGLTNQSFRFEIGGDPFKLRVSGENTRRLGIDREAELAALSAAARAGLAPEVVCFLRPEGHLVTRFVPGTVWGKADLARPEVMRRAVETLRRVHRLSPIAHEFSPCGDIDRRLGEAVAQGITLPEDTADLAGHAAGIERRYWRRPASDAGLCHNDPFAGNFIATDAAVTLIDWEYAGMGDVYYDLACLGVVLPPERRETVLEAYFGEVTEQALAKLAAMRFVMQLWNWTWAVLQVKFSGGNPEHVRIEQALLASARSQMPAR